MQDHAEFQHALEILGDWKWRLNNLYWITDKDGKRVQFKLNWAQERLFNEMHHQNVILKARQLGFTTFIQLFMLDACLFHSNVRAGTIAHNLSDAQAIFRDKVKYPYDNLPEELRARRPIIRDSANELALSNNSTLRVATSLRSGTMQYLHVSEYGKLCAKYPEKAREVRTGALNTVQAGQVVFIESTAEGQEGHFFEVCEQAQSLERLGERLTPLDFKFHFFPWWKAPEYRIDPAGVVIPDALARYFGKLEQADGITLHAAQKAWYVKKAATQLGDMKREYPSTPKEAFEASVEGAYYGKLLEQAELEGRIGDFPAVKELPIHTAWDIARGQYTSIWFWQRLPKRVRIVGFFQNCGQGMPYYAQQVRRLYTERGWLRYDPIDVFPHDARVTEWGSNKSRIEQLMEEGFKPRIATDMDIDDGINAVMATLPHCEFDAAACAEGLRMLRTYRRDWDEEHAVWKSAPCHNDSSHGADAFRYLAIFEKERHSEVVSKANEQETRWPTASNKPAPRELSFTADPQTGIISSNLTIDQIIKRNARRSKR